VDVVMRIAMMPQATRKAGMLLAILATIAIIGDSEVVSEGGHGDISQSAQAKLEKMDQQLWDKGTGMSDQKARSGKVLRRIEETALQQAGFVRQAPEADEESDDESEGKLRDEAALVEKLDRRPAASSELEAVSATNMEMQLDTQRKELVHLKMRAQKADLQAKHDRAVRQVLEEGVGARMREQQRFYSYMSRWWRLHRKWMKRHNVRLYRKLKEHRALSLSQLWKPFLLRWHYVQPRLLQGYRYNWNDDGTYTPKRYLMKSSRKTGDTIVASRIRSVNNLCFPGLLSPQRRNKLCRFKKHVSVRAVQFLLEHEKFSLPSLTVMRAYTTFVPNSHPHLGNVAQWTKAKSPVRFVSIQGLHWNLAEVVEYCSEPTSKTGVSVPRPYDPVTSKPTREYSFKFMEWQPIKMGRELLDTGATVENVELKTKDEKIRISCVVPVDHPQSVDGEEITLTSQKCSIYIRQWDFNLKCPDDKIGTIALKTQVTARDDSGSGNGEPTMTPKFKNQLTFNKNKVSLQFEQQAVLHLHDTTKGTDYRSSVPVIMTQSKKLQWTGDPRFKTSKHVYFSFIVSNMQQLKSGILNWDPLLNGNFNQNPVRSLNVVKTAKAIFNPNGHKTAATAASSTPAAPAVPASVPTPAPKEVNAYEFVQQYSDSKSSDATSSWRTAWTLLWATMFALFSTRYCA